MGTPSGGGRRRAGVRSRVVTALARRFGSVFVLALAQNAESRSPYEGDLDATRAMAADERVHEEVVRALAARGREQVSGTFRAAVFGANDGLVSNLALVLGVSGGGVGTNAVLLAGLAGLLAGALSMGAVSTSPCGCSASSWRLGARVGRAGGGAVPRRERQRARAGLPGARHAPSRLPSGRHSCCPGAPTARTCASTRATRSSGAVRAPRCRASPSSPRAAVPVLPFLLGLTGTPALLTAVVLVACALLVTGATVGLLFGATVG